MADSTFQALLAVVLLLSLIAIVVFAWRLNNRDGLRLKKHPRIELDKQDYPQDMEANEFRYLSAVWLNELAKGLTKGAKKHPGETWRDIPATEHCWRAVRHLVLWVTGDRSEPHLINASMRVMMAFETSKEKDNVCCADEGIAGK